MNKDKYLIFVCNWAGYSSADANGLSKQNIPDNVRIILVQCAGRISTGTIMKAVENGAKGVMILGCEQDECKYIHGNVNTKDNVREAEKLIALLGLDEKMVSFKSVPIVKNDKVFNDEIMKFACPNFNRSLNE